MTDEQKHRLAAQMCLTWRYDYDLHRDQDDPLSSGMTQVERMYLHSKMMQLIDHHWPKDPSAARPVYAPLRGIDEFGDS